MTEISTRRWLRFLFEPETSRSEAERRRTIVKICRELGAKFDFELGTSLRATILREIEAARLDREKTLADLEANADASQIADFIAVALRGESSSDAERLRRLEAFESRLTAPDAALLLETARLREKIGDSSGAIRALRRAFATFPPFAFYLEARALVERLVANAPDACFCRNLRVAVLGSCSTGLFVSTLRAAGVAKGLRFELYEGTFNDYFREIVELDSELYRFKPDVLVLLLESSDPNPGPIFADEDADEYVARIVRLREIWTERSGAPLVHIGLELPSANSWGNLESALQNGRRRQIRRINAALAANLPNNVSFIDPTELAATFDGAWTSDRDWRISKQYPAPDALPTLADAVVGIVAARFGASKKVLALDLDGVCWGGIVGEDGVGGIELGPSTANGENFSALQRFAKELRDKGTLLVACSKNNEADAAEPFEKHGDAVLRRDDFVAFCANWNDKAENLRAVANALNLGLDSFVFVDDSPTERARVRDALPEVSVLEWGDAPWRVVPALTRSRFFESAELTAEDLTRNESYRLRAETAVPLDAPPESVDEFLRELRTTYRSEPIDERNLSRVAQLINKSNQFNLTLRRYDVEETRRRALSPRWRCRAFRLKDRYQEYGIVGAFLVEIDANRWKIDVFVESCRVVGRKLDDFMIAELLKAAKTEGAETIVGRYVPGPRNKLVGDFFPKFGFEKTDVENVWTRRA